MEDEEPATSSGPTSVEFINMQASHALQEAGLDESTDAVDKVTEGKVLARVSFSSLMTKSWAHMFWTVEGQTLLIFDCRDDYYRDPKSFNFRLDVSSLHDCSPITTKRYGLFGSTLDHFTLFATRRPSLDTLSMQRMSELISTPNAMGNYRENVVARFACTPERGQDLRVLRAKVVQMIAVTLRDEKARGKRPTIPSTLAVAAVEVTDRASIGNVGNAQDALEEPEEPSLDELLRGKAITPAVSIPFSDVRADRVPTDAEHEAAESALRKSSVDGPFESEAEPEPQQARGMSIKLPSMFAKSNTSLADQMEDAGEVEDDIHYGYDEG